jgi:hypothetical protein
MRQQPTTTPTVLVVTVNGQPVAAYLRQPEPLDPPRLLIGEVDGHPVTWAPDRYRQTCALHGQAAGCRCLDQLADLATPDALRAWWRRLTRQQARLVRAAAASARPRPDREWPDWTSGWGSRLLVAAGLLGLLLLLAPLLDR